MMYENLSPMAHQFGATPNTMANKNGNLLTVTDFVGNVTLRPYDGNGNLISQTDALGNQTRYEYDNNDQLIKVIDANHHARELGYDFKGRLTRITDALGRRRKLNPLWMLYSTIKPLLVVSVKGNVGNKKEWVKIEQVERDIDTGVISFGETKFNKANHYSKSTKSLSRDSIELEVIRLIR